ncbi:hypothetical protein [Curtobacterium sp. BRD11]|uniref:hypothetical protein n=1 Tax=Curtobacterium sp. BRD11 TaxID=2962581 RepID=UPI0028825E9A|nr:hypothetical protein [Curtobacterium sp. BRD11]MDT0212060.1 hypothetical protein [Curtobacterium sp. BRD11]
MIDETFNPMPDFLPPGRFMTNDEAVDYGCALASSVEPILSRLERDLPGRRREMRFTPVLATFLAFKVQEPKRDPKLADVARWAGSLNHAQRRRLGLPNREWTYFAYQSAFRRLCQELEPEGSDRRVDAFGTVLMERNANLPTLDAFVNTLVAASAKLPAWLGRLPMTPVQAIDSTDIESHARPRAWSAKPDSIDTYIPDDHSESDEWTDDATNWPKVGHLDGRKIVAPDLQARIGWRTRNDDRSTNAFNGYDAHLLVDAGRPGLQYWVPLIRGIALRPAGSYKAQAGLDLIDSLPERSFTHLAADRGYSHAVPDSWAHPLTDRGIIPIHDLHRNQRRPHPSQSMPGVIWIDGSLFPDALPTRLRKLPGFKARASAEVLNELHDLYDERARWAFVPNRRYSNGDVQMKGPARAGHLRCPNYAPSHRLPAHVPRTTCKPGTDCACAATKVIPANEAAWERQRYPFGTTKWASYYGLRNLVESDNAQLKFWRGSMRRHSTHVFGVTANTLVLAFNCIAVNISMLRDTYGEDVDPTAPDYPQHRAPRRRRLPKTPALHLRKKTQRNTTAQRTRRHT